jgi:hypothetical protein
MPSKRERERQEKRKEGKVSYDLPPEVKQNVADLAAEYGVPQSQIATVLLLFGLDAMQNGQIDIVKYLVPSRSPLHTYNIDIDRLMDEWGK